MDSRYFMKGLKKNGTKFYDDEGNLKIEIINNKIYEIKNGNYVLLKNKNNMMDKYGVLNNILENKVKKDYINVFKSDVFFLNNDEFDNLCGHLKKEKNNDENTIIIDNFIFINNRQ